MSKRALFLLILVLGGGGYFMHKHWGTILEVLHLSASGEETAVVLARRGYSMISGQENNKVVMSRTSTDSYKRIGWRVKKVSEAIYIVRYEFVYDDQADAFYFEVDIAAERVFFIDDNERLIKKYGLPAKPN